MRISEITFVASGVLVVTGGLASLLSRRLWHKRQFQMLATLVVLMAAMVVLHWLWHRLSVSHDWLEPLYVGTLLVYCGTALSVARRLLPRDGSAPPA